VVAPRSGSSPVEAGTIRARPIWLGKIVLGGIVLGKIRLGEIRPGEIRPDKTRPDETRPDETRLVETWLGTDPAPTAPGRRIGSGRPKPGPIRSPPATCAGNAHRSPRPWPASKPKSRLAAFPT